MKDLKTYAGLIGMIASLVAFQAGGMLAFDWRGTTVILVAITAALLVLMIVMLQYKD